jgi:hypothetical protein
MATTLPCPGLEVSLTVPPSVWMRSRMVLRPAPVLGVRGIRPNPFVSDAYDERAVLLVQSERGVCIVPGVSCDVLNRLQGGDVHGGFGLIGAAGRGPF